jgi:pimeloyl-ACP methyl ester carboxylesterase
LPERALATNVTRLQLSEVVHRDTAMPKVMGRWGRPPATALLASLCCLIRGPIASEHATSSPEQQLATSTVGKGTPVVIVTGMLGSAYGFRKVIPRLVADSFRVTVVDPLGFGASPRPDNADYSFTAQADRVARTIDALGGGPVILVCHALAGTICLRLAYRRPDLVRGIVSINGGASEQAGTTEMRFALKFARVVLFFAGRSFAVRKVKQGLIESSGDTTWVADSVVDRYVGAFGTDARQIVRSLEHIVASHDSEPLRPNLGRVTAPVLLLFGPTTRNPKNPTVASEERVLLRSALPRFEEEDVAGAGEYIQEEQPARVVAAISRMRDETRR